MGSNTKGCFHVASWENSIIIKIEEYATLNNSLFFRTFVEQMLEKGFRNFIVDLSLCKGMDSTFMGVLIGIINFEGEQTANVTLININDYHQKLLDGLGISQILDIKTEPMNFPSLTMEKLEEKDCNLDTRLKMIQQAHQRLVQLNDKNKQQFGTFLKMLEQEMVPDN